MYRFGTQGRAYYLLLNNSCRCFQFTGFQYIGQILALFYGKVATDL